MLEQYDLSLSSDELYDPSPRPSLQNAIEYEQCMASLQTELQQRKSLIAQISTERWKLCRDLICPASMVPHHLRNQHPMASFAWVKMMELLQHLKILLPNQQTFHSLHLCEAPGAFVAAFRYYMQTWCPHIRHTWKASTLRQDKALQRLRGYSFLDETETHWMYGRDGTGDILRTSIQQDIWIENGLHNCDLVTADGGVEYRFEKQESLALPLIRAQTIVALGALRAGGTLILKMFTCLEGATASWVIALGHVFERSGWWKPVASKGTNSEIYWVGRNFLPTRLELDLPLLLRSPSLFEKWCCERAEKLLTAQQLIVRKQIQQLSDALELAMLPLQLVSSTFAQQMWTKSFLDFVLQRAKDKSHSQSSPISSTALKRNEPPRSKQI